MTMKIVYHLIPSSAISADEKAMSFSLLINTNTCIAFSRHNTLTITLPMRAVKFLRDRPCGPVSLMHGFAFHAGDTV